jgi:hypothetical protein
MIDRRPDAVVRYADVMDVMTAVNLRATEILRLQCGGGDKDAGLGRLQPRSCD